LDKLILTSKLRHLNFFSKPGTLYPIFDKKHSLEILLLNKKGKAIILYFINNIYIFIVKKNNVKLAKFINCF
jgi:hypothetical protein